MLFRSLIISVPTIVLALTTQQVQAEEELFSRVASQTGRDHEGEIDCEVAHVDFDLGNGESMSTYRCLTYGDDVQYQDLAYDLPERVIEKYSNKIHSKKPTYLHVSKASEDKNGESLAHIDEQSTVQSSDHPYLPYHQHKSDSESRRLQAVTGAKKVLVVRANMRDATVPLSADILRSRVFGRTGSPAAAYQGCSFGKLRLEAATGAHINGGVMNINIDLPFVGQNSRDFENKATAAVQNLVDPSTYSSLDHIMFCFPAGSHADGHDWNAYAYTGRKKAFFNGESCGHLSSLVHELGHNMGLGHSGDAFNTYNDLTDVMGYGNSEIGGPINCFNAAKHAQLGWYSDKSVLLDLESNGAWKGQLFAYSDYGRASGNVLIGVSGLYLQYNKVGTVNSGLPFHREKIAVVESLALEEGEDSVLLAGLDAGEYVTTSKGIVIEVCGEAQSNGEYFDVSIRKSDQASACAGAYGYTAKPWVNAPEIPTLITRAAAARPSTIVPNPTPAPTRAPTPNPTSRPTPAPTDKPSSSPSAAPTDIPSTSPTVVHSSMPSQSPSKSVPTISAAPSISTRPTTFPTVTSTTTSPTVAVTSGLVCDDHPTAEFFVNEREGYKMCIWLAARPAMQEELCSEDSTSGARQLCEETCGICTDTCEDTNGKFMHHGVKRPCSWLSIRTFVQDLVCVPGEEAMDLCPETCNSCDERVGESSPGVN